jgi:hypothetical protein
MVIFILRWKRLNSFLYGLQVGEKKKAHQFNGSYAASLIYLSVQQPLA